MNRLVFLALLTTPLGAAPLAAQSGATSGSTLEHVRTALSKYQDPMAAVRDGYLSTVSCMTFPQAGMSGEMHHPAGGMGVHFLNVGLIGPTVDTLRPQVLIYEPDGDKLKLVAAEWFVPTQADSIRPELFGHPFDGPMEGHEPIMPPELRHWDLHVWLWKPNPAGMFSSTNPNVLCPMTGYTHRDHPPMQTHAH